MNNGTFRRIWPSPAAFLTRTCIRHRRVFRGQDFTISANKLAFETNCVGEQPFAVLAMPAARLL